MSNENETPEVEQLPNQLDSSKLEKNESVQSDASGINESVNSGNGDSSNSDDDPETFTREYVQNLRDESARYRTRAKDRDAVATRLHTSLVAATGRLADPTDLTFDDGHLDDAEALTTAIDELLATKPHLASRKPSGDVGQGATGSTEGVDLAALLRARAS